MDIRYVSINAGNGFDGHDHRAEGVWEFHFLLDSGGVFESAGVQYPGRAGSLFLAAPADWHRAWVPRRGQTMTIYSVSFVPAPADEPLFARLGRLFAERPEVAAGRGSALVFEDLRRRFSSGNELQRESLGCRLSAYIYDLLSGQSHDHPPRGQMYVDEALVVMQSRLAGQLDLDELAGKLGIDKSYFIRIFKQIMGEPPLKYFHSLKMNAASHQLRCTAAPIRQIAAEFGYEDEYYFSRLFKVHMGVSPLEFRNRR